jgi:hypothetical protein
MSQEMGGAAVRRASSESAVFIRHSILASGRGRDKVSAVAENEKEPEPQAEPAPEPVAEYWRWCPRCGHELHNEKCKFRCPRCHYFMSCSDFD